MTTPSTNPHWKRGETDAEHARRRGWGVGTHLVGDEGYGPTVITITAIGQDLVLARDAGREHLWTLRYRDWQPVAEDDKETRR